MKKILSFIVILSALLTSCEKTIDIDYHEVEPLYVVEASVTENGAFAKISMTQNVTDAIGGKPVDNAMVTIVSDHGEQCVLHLDSAGSYSSSELKGKAGHNYTIKVQIGDYITESTSEMQDEFEVGDIYMYKVQMMEDDLVYYHVDVQDTCSEQSYYYTLVSRNGEPYKWNVMTDKGYQDITSVDVPCFVYCELDKDNKDILTDGECISVEVRKIDRRTYDYLYALAMSERSASNPIRNFTNPATLGYFSAHHSIVNQGLVFAKDSLQYN